MDRNKVLNQFYNKKMKIFIILFLMNCLEAKKSFFDFTNRSPEASVVQNVIIRQIKLPTIGTTTTTSTLGSSWTARTIPTADWKSVTFGNGLFVAVAQNTNFAVSSPDGITWTSRTLPSGGDWRSVSFGNGVFVATSSGGDAATSTDGINWTARTLPSGTWLSSTFGNGIFVVVGNNSVATSP